MTPGLFKLLEKHAAASNLAPSRANQEFLDNHFVETSTGKWRAFKNKLTSPAFVAAVKQDDRADRKLKRYTEMNGRHMQAKGVPSFQVPSQSKGGSYTVKYHPDLDRYSCNCGDWVHVQSTKTGKNRNCKHIQMLELELQSQGKRPRVAEPKTKTAAAIRGAAAGVLLGRLLAGS
jgi:hypothetical protein